MLVINIFNAPEHEVLRVGYCDRAVPVVDRASSVVNFLPCVPARGHIFSPRLMKLGQNVYLNPFPNKPWFLRVCSTSLLKTL